MASGYALIHRNGRHSIAVLTQAKPWELAPSTPTRTANMPAWPRCSSSNATPRTPPARNARTRRDFMTPTPPPHGSLKKCASAFNVTENHRGDAYKHAHHAPRRARGLTCRCSEMALSLVMLTFQALTARKKCPEVATFGAFSCHSGRAHRRRAAPTMPHENGREGGTLPAVAARFLDVHRSKVSANNKHRSKGNHPPL